MTIAHQPRQPVPWRPGEAIWTTVLNVVGVLVVLLGWLGVSGSARLSHQYAWTSVAVVGLLFAGFGNGLWLLAGRRAVGVRRRRLLIEPASRPALGGATIASTNGTATSNGTGHHELVRGVGMTKYHRPECMLVRGKAVEPFQPGGRGRRTAEPCGICTP